MRKALIGILLAATVAAPMYAAQAQRGRGGDDVDRTQPRAERQAERAERQEQRSQNQAQRSERQAQRVERQQAQPQAQTQQAQSWQGRGNRGGGGDGGSWQRRQSGQESVQTQQNWQRRQRDGGSNQGQQAWGGRGDSQREAYRRQVEETRAASAASAAEGSPALQRRAAQNQARYEQRLREQRRDGRRDWDGNDRRGDRSGWSDNRRDGRSNWNRGWRNDNRYDWQRYRYSNRDIFRRGNYYAPYRNHRYNRLSIGFFLQTAFFGQNYWISDPWYYRLPPAYPGTRWVRYYDDVLLIDVYSGEVIDVIHDFFW